MYNFTDLTFYNCRIWSIAERSKFLFRTSPFSADAPWRRFAALMGSLYCKKIVLTNRHLNMQLPYLSLVLPIVARIECTVWFTASGDGPKVVRPWPDRLLRPLARFYLLATPNPKSALTCGALGDQTRQAYSW